MSTSNVARTRFGANREVPVFMNVGGVVTVGSAGVLSSSSCQDTVTAAVTVTLPNGAIQIGTLKEVVASGAAVTLGAPLAANGVTYKILNGSTLQVSASISSGGSVVLQYLGAGQWKVVKTSGTVSFS